VEKIPITIQKQFWDHWVGQSFEFEKNPDNARRKIYVLNEVKKQESNLKILDIGCGSGWLSRELAKYGEVTATDLASKAMELLQGRFPGIQWIGGDFLSIELPANHYHLVTCLETIAHVPDQKAFAERIAQVTRPGGTLLLTTQNETIWNRTSWLKPPGEGQIRNWPTKNRLKELFEPHFTIEKIVTCAPGGDKGWPRLFNNKVATKFGRTLFGQERWVRLLEKWGLGRSLFLVGKRFNDQLLGTV
jgi:2-polyprenyl-3-methyl-5-hydroxy-6-metoxy-1,4-benzoquinol methylase